MGLFALFGIENSGLALAVNLLLLFLVVIWLALVYWTYSDAHRRIADPMLVACATAASLFPFIGTIVYLIVRPPEYLDDVRERELEIAAAQARLANLEHQHCQYCGFEIEKTFLRCPSCLRRLKEPCTVCGKPLDPRWKICPYCEAEVGQAAEGTRRRPRRAAASAQAVPPRQAAQRPSSSARQGGPPDATAVERPARAGGDRPQSAG
jgi:double zinc ribbon protein